MKPNSWINYAKYSVQGKKTNNNGLTTLESRRLRGDQIEVFKILNGYENIDRNIFFPIKEEKRTREHGVTLAKKQCRLDIRTVNEWKR